MITSFRQPAVAGTGAINAGQLKKSGDAGGIAWLKPGNQTTIGKL